jgi:hypothetical protein
LASSFVLWVAGVIGGKYFLHQTKKSFLRSNYFLAILFLVGATISYSVIPLSFSSANNYEELNSNSTFVPTDSPNSPIGVAKGIFPGRVVWNYNPNATNYRGSVRNSIDGSSGATSSPAVEGNWYLEGNIVQSEVDKMLSETLCELTGTNSDSDSWNAIFKFFNKNHGKGETGYQQGEKIAVKINLNNSKDHKVMNTASNISPQMALGLLRQLVLNAEVPASMITFYDVSRQIPSSIFDLCKKEFPEVNFVDQVGGDGRLKGVADKDNQLKWSVPLVLEPLANPGNPTYLPTCVTEAAYLINFSNLKAHGLGGISLCAKNMFGSYISPNSKNLQPPQSAGVHPYVAVRTSDGYKMRPMKSYNVLVDLLGNKNLGEKTILFLVDGLYAVPWQWSEIDNTCKWNSAPFEGNWTSSLYASFDDVALESVCLDFLRAEQSVSTSMTAVSGNVDNYLHEAALANNPPSGTIYRPNDTTRLSSLGVHEHWNNASEKKYSRNLGTGEGIELISVKHDWIPTGVNKLSDSNNGVVIYPIPASDIVHLKLNNQINGEGILALYAISGNLLYKEKIEKYTSNYTKDISISKYIGVLVLKISIGDQTFTKTIIRASN